MKKMSNSSFRTLLLAAAGLSLIGSTAYADDIEIFTGQRDNSQANILFAIDMSGSMRWHIDTPPGTRGEEPDDFSETRFASMQRALKGALGRLEGVNIGFTEMAAGGARVSYPMSDIDGDVAWLDGNNEVRSHVIDYINNLDPIGGTPTVGTLYESARYYRGEQVALGAKRGVTQYYDYWDWKDWYDKHHAFHRLSHPSSYTGGRINLPAGCSTSDYSSAACMLEELVADDSLENPTPLYNSPITSACQQNFMILVTDGEASILTDSQISKVESMIGKSCVEKGSDTCSVELVKHLYETDQNDTLPGTQNVITYTIGFAHDSAILKSLANVGGGQYFTANDEERLVEVLKEIIDEVKLLQNGSSFVPPVLPISYYNQLKHSDQVYMSMFDASEDSVWEGNLKSYFWSAESGLLDKDRNEALDADTGKLLSSAKSRWALPGEAADGENITAGGMAARLPSERVLLTNVKSSKSITHNQNKIIKLNENITAELLGVDGDDRNELIDWISGLNDDGSHRNYIGDIIHSSPVVVEYKAGKFKSIIATNEGFIHMVDTETGIEDWAFMPKEMLEKQKVRKANSSAEHQYGFDGSLTYWPGDYNQNGTIDAEAGEQAILLATMRRGGNNIYALDVTDVTQPELLWVIEGGSESYSQLNQTWSAPQVVHVYQDNVLVPAIVFAGGYDTNQDTMLPLLSDRKGKAIYIADIKTGQRLWWAGDVNSGADLALDFDHSIAADVSVINIDGDAVPEAIFVADTGANIWRIDFDTDRGNTVGEGGKVASFAGLLRSERRRTFNGLDISLGEYGKNEYAVSFGTGHRANPLSKDISNYFISFKQPIDKVWADHLGSDVIELSDLLDVTNRVVKSTSSFTTSEMAQINNGWKIAMNTGEKVLGRSITVNEQIIFSTYTPGAAGEAACGVAPGINKSYVVGQKFAEPKIDLDDDPNNPSPELTILDRYKVLKNITISPEPVVLFPKDAKSPQLVIGAELVDIDFGALKKATYWEEIVME